MRLPHKRPEEESADEDARRRARGIRKAARGPGAGARRSAAGRGAGAPAGVRGLPHRPLHRLGGRPLRLRPDRARPRGSGRGREGRPRRLRAGRGRSCGHPVLGALQGVRPLPRRAHQPLPRDPRRAGQGPPARRQRAALARRRGDAPLHGLLDLRGVHGDVRVLARQGQPRGARRAHLPVRLRALDRPRCCDQHRQGRTREHLRRLRRRDGRARRRRRLPSAGRRANRLRRPLRGPPRARQGGRARPTSWRAARARSSRSSR